jgi:metal-dependent hydrolase (beta-lactamase superfamily II)
MPTLTPVDSLEVQILVDNATDGLSSNPPHVESETQGLAVLSACSHAGIVNVLKDARASFPGTPLYAALSAAFGDKVLAPTAVGKRYSF